MEFFKKHGVLIVSVIVLFAIWYFLIYKKGATETGYAASPCKCGGGRNCTCKDRVPGINMVTAS